MKGLLNKLVSPDLGYSLVEVMVGGGILAGLALAGATMFKDQRLGQKRIEHEQALQSYHNSLSHILKNVNNCNATFRSFFNQTAVGDINQINVCMGGCDIKATAQNVSAMATFASEGSWIDDKQIWRINSITVPATNTTSEIFVTLTYSMNPKIPGARTVVKSIPVGVRFSKNVPSTFMECYDVKESSVNTMQNDLCRSFGGQVTSIGNIFRWDEAAQTCVRNGASQIPVKDCPAGFHIEGIRTDGTVNCEPIYFDGTPNTAPSTCLPGRRPRLDVTAGQVRVLCVP